MKKCSFCVEDIQGDTIMMNKPLPKQFNAILWDNDGVLVDTETLYFKATQDVFKRHSNIQVSWKMFEQYFLLSNKGSLGICQDYRLPSELAPIIRVERDDHYMKYLENDIPVIDGVMETLEKLKGRVKMGIVTSCKHRHLELMHQHTTILSYMDFIIANEDVSNTKPDPEPYLKGVEELSIEKSKILVIEDSVRGMQSAINAGIPCAVIPRYSTGVDQFEQADYYLSSITQVLDLI